MNSQDKKIVFVGGGLVGPLCSIFLAKRGYQVSLYEYREDPRCSTFTRGRSINLALSNRARRALRQIGLEEKILKCAVPMKGRFIHNLNGKNKSIPYDFRTKECIYSVERNYLNQTLLDAMENYPNIKLLFNHKLVSADLKAGRLTFLQNDSSTIEVYGDLLVGADGAFSSLRRVMQQTPLFNFSQTYIDHGYIEMNIASEAGKEMLFEHLHIWPRGKFMMIALPNRDGSWTVTLFMPFEKFEKLDTPNTFLDFFKNVFPDAVDLIGKERLAGDFFKLKPSSLVSVKCNKYHVGENALIIGDAAHAMVPFYGQGMNAGFEDCSLLNEMFEKCKDDIATAIQRFSETRTIDAQAICDLAMYNYVEMRDLVTRPSYLIRKTVDDFLYWLFPEVWVPLYNSVTFSKMGYRQCVQNRQWQYNIFRSLFLIITLVISLVVIIAIKPT